MTESFPPSVKARLRKNYNWTCTICLNPLPVEGSHCAHLFDASKAGAEQVTDAVSLGLLDPTEPYSRKAATNGIILCPTCHLGYFTCGRLVLSPPMPVLEWITGKLKGATDSAAVWQIFSELEFSRSPQLLRYKNHYSLIPFFRSEDKESYELYCNKPTMVVNHDGAYRIFSYKKTHQHRTPVIVRFTSTPPCEGPTDYWYIPVSCHIILYIFLQRAINRVSKSPEVTLARQIYAKLLELRGIPSRATFSIIAVDAEVSFEESSLAGDSVYAEIDTYPNSMDLAGLRPGAMMPAGDNEGGRRRTACGRLAPAHPCCGREHKGNTTHICSVCYTVVRKSIPPEISTFEDEAKGGCETRRKIHRILAGWISGSDVNPYSVGATLAAGAMLGVFGTLILRRRML